MNDLLQQYGGYGIAVALAAFVMYLLGEHKKERKEILKTIEKLFEKSDIREKETNTVIKDHTAVLASLKTLFEHDIKRKRK